MIDEQKVSDLEQPMAESESADQESSATPAIDTPSADVNPTTTTIDSDNDSTNLEQEINSLKEQLTEQIQQTEAFKAQYMRIAADFENFRRRSLKEKEEIQQQVKRNTIVELLGVIDNFERARTQIKPNTDAEKTIHNSYQGVYKIFVESLKKLGVSAMRPEGQPFDPNYHEAMLREETDEHPEGTVIDQLMRGYLLDNLVIRHAMVKVAVPKEAVITSEEEKAEIDSQLETTEN